MHALLLATGVDGDDAHVDHNHHAHDEVVFLQNYVGDQRDQVQGLLFRAVQLHHHHQQVGPGENRATGRTNVTSWLKVWREEDKCLSVHVSPLCDAFVRPDDGGLEVDGVVTHPSQLHGLLQGTHHVQSIVALCTQKANSTS